MAAAEKKIGGLLESGGYLKKAQVNIIVSLLASQQVSVLGQVNRPGRYPVDGKRSVLDMLALAGGIAADGGDTVSLVRTRNGKTTRETIDVIQMVRSGALDGNFDVAGGDMIYVERAPRFYIVGEVQRPGAFRVERQMTVLQALSAGGGLTAARQQQRPAHHPQGRQRQAGHVRGQARRPGPGGRRHHGARELVLRLPAVPFFPGVPMNVHQFLLILLARKKIILATLAVTVLLTLALQPGAAEDLQGDRVGAAELQGRRSADRADHAGPAAAGLHGDPDRHHQQQERGAAGGRRAQAGRQPGRAGPVQRQPPTGAATCATGWPTCC